jgi:hypothetical protein
MKSKNNLETAIGFLDNLLSQISPDHPAYDEYIKAVNTAVSSIKVCQAIKIKSHYRYLKKKNKENTTKDAN